MPGNRAGARCICCKAWCNASTVAMPSTGNASARVPAKASRARTPITAAWARMPTALAASGVCQNTQVRTDLLDLAVWQEVCTLLAHPERLAEEYRRRLQPETRGQTHAAGHGRRPDRQAAPGRRPVDRQLCGGAHRQARV